MRLTRLLLTLSLCASMAACNKDGKSESTDTEKTPTPQTQATPVVPESNATPDTDKARPPGTAAPDNTGNTAGTGDTATPEMYFAREINKADLAGRSLRELSLMRNTIFARGGNKFRKAWIRDYFKAQPWYQEAEELDKSKLTDVDWKNIQIIAEVERSFSREQLEARKSALLQSIGDATPSPEQRVELELLSRRVGKWVGPDRIEPEKRSPLEDPAQLERTLALADLEDMSRKDLRILRNTIYARRGYVFKSPILTDYFSNMEWYQPDDKYTDDRLTKLDWQNITLVKSVENELGGPISDSFHNEIDWFDAA